MTEHMDVSVLLAVLGLAFFLACIAMFILKTIDNISKSQ